jgi:site-specific recombinase XerD
LATCLINEGVPLKQISDILGHANIQTTLIYTKVDVRHLNEVARPFPAMKDN